jgi:transposase InsO family protein
VESFFHTLKTEMIYHEHFETRDQAHRMIFEWVEAFYKSKSFVARHRAINVTKLLRMAMESSRNYNNLLFSQQSGS